MKTMRLCLAIAALAIGPLAHADDHGDDHGNTADTATRVALPGRGDAAVCRAPCRGVIVNTGEQGRFRDQDWFRFEVPESITVIVRTTGDLDTVGDLFNANGRLLTTNDDAVPDLAQRSSSTAGPNLNFRIEKRLDVGTYYVRVTSYYESDGGRYRLHLGTRTATGDDHGDDISSVTVVALPSQTNGTIGNGFDSDWFLFEVTSPGTVTAFTTSNGLDTVGHLYDASGNWLATNDDSPGFSDFRIRETLSAGAYYMSVSAPSGGFRGDVYDGSYVLHLRQSGAEDAHGDSAASATAVALPGNISAHIDPAGDEDWFRLETTSAGALTIRASVTSGDLFFDLVLDSRIRGDTACSANCWPSGSEAVVAVPHVSLDHDSLRLGRKEERELSIGAGTHYLKVQNTNDWGYGGGTGDYALELRFDSALDAAPGHLRDLGDFNGDGRDDVLLRHREGRWHYYPMAGNRVLPGRGVASLTRDLTWQTAGIGDFDGDGRDDVLLRKTDGRWYFYQMDGRTVLDGSGPVSMTRDLAWQVAGIGDFDGDGKDDVLLRKTDGRWYFYPMDGRTVLGGRGTVRLPWDLAWQVAGVGDFDVDGRHDVLLRHEDGGWQYYPLQGRRVLTGADVPLPLGMTVAGIGNLDGYAGDDVLLRAPGGRWFFYAPLDEYSSWPGLNSDLAWAALGNGNTWERDCAECPVMVRIPAGTFTQGSPESEVGRNDNEGPQREVSVPAFAAGVYEVTFAEWDACVAAGGCGEYHPADDGGRGDRPVVRVSWDDAQLYVDWLSEVTGQRYRLLTESEWEYAARAGTTTPFHTGETITSEQANFNGQRGYPAGESTGLLWRQQTVPVGSFPPNGFDLHDMHGNVWEWVQDCWSDSYAEAPSDGSAVEGDSCPYRHVLRGGSWYNEPSALRAANRYRNAPAIRYFRFGFRVARTL